MFSVRQKREIADAIQKILRDTDHPELPEGEIKFEIMVVVGADPSWSWARIRNNGAVTNPGVNPHNERQDLATRLADYIKSRRALFSHVTPLDDKAKDTLAARANELLQLEEAMRE